MLVVLLSGVLGAATLAVILLSRAHRRDRARITQLSAELAVHQLKALALGASSPTAGAEQSAPVRSKRHLSLYIGGGVVAVLTSWGDRLRDIWRGHRVATTTVTVAAASVAAVGAFALTSGGDALQLAPPSSSGAADEPSETATPDVPSRSADAARRRTAAASPLSQLLPDNLTDRLLKSIDRDKIPTPSSSPAPDPVTDDGIKDEAGAVPAPPASDPAPETNAPSAPTKPGEATPTQPPTTPTAAPPSQASPEECFLGVDTPLLDLCVR